MKSAVAVMLCSLVQGGIAQASESVPLFSSGDARSVSMRINRSAVDQLRSDAESITLSSVPLITGESASFILRPMEIFGPDTVIEAVTDNLGTTEAVALPDIRTWYGRDPRHEDRGLFLSAKPDGQIRMMVTGNRETSVTVISPRAGGSGDEYQIAPAVLPPVPFCHTESTGVFVDESTGHEVGVSANRNNITFEVEMMIDAGYRLYDFLEGDTTLVAQYIIDLFGAANVPYMRDINTRLKLSSLTIWTIPDPFSRLSTREINAGSTAPITTNHQLTHYQNWIQVHRGNVHRDLAHFVDRVTGIGGIAYVDIMGPHRRQFRCAVSNVHADSVFPDPDDVSFFWDTVVFAHEIGHNLGSPHTHCYSPPIDCCAADCVDCAYDKPTTGTIMSYCHLHLYSGGNVNVEFHPRVRTVLRNKVENSLLLTPVGEFPEIEVLGIGGGIAPTGGLEAGRSTTLVAMAAGDPAVQETFTIRNAGAKPLLLYGNPVLTYQGDLNLSIVSQPTSTNIPPGGTSTFVIRYNPAVVANQRGMVTLHTNDPMRPTYDIGIMGRVRKISSPFEFTWEGEHVIPDGTGEWAEIPVRVFDIPSEAVVGKVSLRFNGTNCAIDELTGLQHSYISDLDIQLVSPAGTTMSLMTRPGSDMTSAGIGGRNFCHTLFDDEGADGSIQAITAEMSPFTGSFTPHQALAIFRDEMPSGVWRLRIRDSAQPDQGIVRSFTLIIQVDLGAGVSTDAVHWNRYD